MKGKSGKTFTILRNQLKTLRCYCDYRRALQALIAIGKKNFVVSKMLNTFLAFVYILKPERLYINNYFKSDCDRKVLISYINYPFVDGALGGHTNALEAIEIANIFHRQGFQVDLVRFDADIKKINFKNEYYDVIFGQGKNFAKLINMFKHGKSIYYATTSHYGFHNGAEKNRLKQLEQRRGALLKQVRYIEPDGAPELADALICIGNEQTKSTYKNKCKQIECIRVSAKSVHPFSAIRKNKQWQEAARKFIWFGSSGAVHKGLDILLEVFSRNQALSLYVCGGIYTEKDFLRLYRKELFGLPNIHFMGFVDPASQEFKDLATECAFVVMPSCSEGMNSAVPTCMYAGVIPLVTRETGLDVEDAGVTFENDDIKTIEKTILKCSEKGTGWIIDRAEESYSLAQKNHSLKSFRHDFENALKKINVTTL